jgi:hypothetical protein
MDDDELMREENKKLREVNFLENQKREQKKLEFKKQSII